MEPCKQAVPARIPPFPPPPCQTSANGRPGRNFNKILKNRSPALFSGIFPEIRATGPGNCPNFWNGARKKGRRPAARFLPGNSRSRRPGLDFLRSSKGGGRKQQNPGNADPNFCESGQCRMGITLVESDSNLATTKQWNYTLRTTLKTTFHPPKRDPLGGRTPEAHRNFLPPPPFSG